VAQGEGPEFKPQYHKRKKKWGGGNCCSLGSGTIQYEPTFVWFSIKVKNNSIQTTTIFVLKSLFLVSEWHWISSEIVFFLHPMPFLKKANPERERERFMLIYSSKFLQVCLYLYNKIFGFSPFGLISVF
jgi:hypothetical protein